MRTILFKILIAFLFLIQEVSAQDSVYSKKFSKAYVKLEMGYALGVGGSRYYQEIDNSSNYTTTPVATPFSYGKGFSIGAALGYEVNQNIALELGLSELIGGYNTANNVYYVHNPSGDYLIYQTDKLKANSFRINPSLILSTKLNKIDLYSRLGFIYVIAKGTEDLEENVKYVNGSTAHGLFSWDFTGGKAFGTSQSLGIKTLLRDNVKFFAELTHISMSGTFSAANRTVYVINDVDNLNNLNVYDKQIIYTKSFTTPDPNPNINQPKKLLQKKHNWDSMGINIGLIIYIQKPNINKSVYSR
ncbi:MAG TPA: hypothetical protein VNW99_13315 [Cytophagaceae bacterium]|jgi:hypothetical protein|nr:hypothetical protein [Cytophagaceae bacterium]